MIRPAVPISPGPMRQMVCYGGPDDGKIVTARTPPAGYKDFGGALVIWMSLNHKLLWPN